MPEQQLELEAQDEHVDGHVRGLTRRRGRIWIRNPLARPATPARRSQEEISEGSLPAATYRRDAVYRLVIAPNG